MNKKKFNWEGIEDKGMITYKELLKKEGLLEEEENKMSKWKHWCPNGCGKQVMWLHNKDFLYKCDKCLTIFKKVAKDTFKEVKRNDKNTNKV